MNAMRSLLMNIRGVLACVGEMFRYALMFLWAIFCPKAVLAARLLAAESQLAACSLQARDRFKEAATATIHSRLSSALGSPLKVPGQVGRSCPSDAASDSQEMAYRGLPLLLAMEVM